MAHTQYFRDFQLVVYDTGGAPLFNSKQKTKKVSFNKENQLVTGITNANPIYPGVDVSQLRCTFMIQKQLNLMQISEITIYNLSPDTETNILYNATNVSLSAGYVNSPFGQIYSGRIIQKIRGKEDGVTYFLRLVCLTADDALNCGFANVAMGEGTDQKKQAEIIARSSTVPFEPKIDDALANGQKSARGKTFFGRPRDMLRSLALNTNSSAYVDNGDIKVTELNSSPPGNVPEVNYQTGMIGIPHQTDQGVEVRVLINPNLEIDGWVHLNNKTVIKQQVSINEGSAPVYPFLDLDGLYHIIGMAITGDTRGNDWYMDLTTVTQLGPTNASVLLGSQTSF